MEFDDDMPQSILFFIGGSYVAGVEIVTLNLIRGLKENNFNVKCVINGWNDGSFKKRLADLNVPYLEVKLGWLYVRKPLWTMDTLIHFPKAYFLCKKLLKEFKPDIVHFCNFAMPLMLLPLIKRNSVYTLHDTHLPNLKYRVIYNLLKKKISVFIAVSNHISLSLKRLAIPETSIKMVYNGITIPPLKMELNKKNCEVPFYFGIVGQVAEWKGHEVLINAVQLLIDKSLTNFKVFIIGNDASAYSKYLINLLEQRKLSDFFVWKGFISVTDEIYKDVEVVIIPSLCEEAFSLTTAEAMVRGLGVIASRRGALTELIEDGVNGLLFNPGDANALCECMFVLLKERDRLLNLGVNAKDKATQNYSSEIMTAKYISIYKELFISLKQQ